MHEKIENFIREYLDKRKAEKRYTSFDYCYNYFYSFFEDNQQSQLQRDENLEFSCLHLGFYLASWGMFRGSSPLLDRSLVYFEDLIKKISDIPKEV